MSSSKGHCGLGWVQGEERKAQLDDGWVQAPGAPCLSGLRGGVGPVTVCGWAGRLSLISSTIHTHWEEHPAPPPCAGQ